MEPIKGPHTPSTHTHTALSVIPVTRCHIQRGRGSSYFTSEPATKEIYHGKSVSPVNRCHMSRMDIVPETSHAEGVFRNEHSDDERVLHQYTT